MARINSGGTGSGGGGDREEEEVVDTTEPTDTDPSGVRAESSSPTRVASSEFEPASRGGSSDLDQISNKTGSNRDSFKSGSLEAPKDGDSTVQSEPEPTDSPSQGQGSSTSTAQAEFKRAGGQQPENAASPRREAAEQFERAGAMQPDNTQETFERSEEIGGEATTYSDRELQRGEQKERVRSDVERQLREQGVDPDRVDITVNRTEDGFEASASPDTDEESGDIDWSGGLGDPNQDEVEQFVDETIGEQGSTYVEENISPRLREFGQDAKNADLFGAGPEEPATVRAQEGEYDPFSGPSGENTPGNDSGVGPGEVAGNLAIAGANIAEELPKVPATVLEGVEGANYLLEATPAAGGSEEQYLQFIHRPDRGTPLKNGRDGERAVGLTEYVVDVLDAYIANQRHEKFDDNGDAPLFASEVGRASPNAVRAWMYLATQPCLHSPCPHGNERKACEYVDYSKGSQCPSSRSPHQVRTGSITWQLNRGVPIEAVAERVNTSVRVLKRHYDQPTRIEELEERRREHVDRLGFSDGGEGE